jgi:hypothetical protein
MIKKKNLGEALKFLRDRGLTVLTGDRVSVSHLGFTPDAQAVDAHNRVVAVVVDDTESPDRDRVRAFKEFEALDSRMSLVLVEAPSFMRPSKSQEKRERTQRFSKDNRPQ